MKPRLVSVLLALSTLASIAPAHEAGQPRHIATLGVAERRYPAERANLYLAIEAVKPTAADARAAVAQTQGRVEQALQQLGVAPADIRLITRRAGRRTRWDDDQDKYIFLGHHATQVIQVVVRDLEKLEPVSVALGAFDEVDIQGTSYESDQEAAVKREALLAAAQVAREKAEALAAASGVRITTILEINEESSDDGRSYGNPAANTTREVAPGDGLTTLRLSVTVRARFAIE